MEFEMSPKALKRVVARVSEVGATRTNVLQSFSNIIIEVLPEGEVVFRVSDQEKEIITNIKSPGAKQGKVAVRAAAFAKLGDAVSGDLPFSIYFDSTSNRLIAQPKGAEIKYPILSHTEYHGYWDEEITNSQSENKLEVSIKADELALLFEATHDACSAEDTLRYLTGVYLHFVKENNGKNELRAVASNGHRLMLKSMQFDGEIPEGFKGVLVPRKTAKEVAAFLRAVIKEFNPDIDANKLVNSDNQSFSSFAPTVKIVIANSKIMFSCRGCITISRLVDGEFPDYPRLFPDHEYKIQVELEALQRSCRSVSAVEGAITLIAEFCFINDDGCQKLKISGSDHNYGSSSSWTNISGFDGNKVCVSFNASYIRDGLKKLDVVGNKNSISKSSVKKTEINKKMNKNIQMAQIKFTDKSTPAVFQLVGDDTLQYLVMPTIPVEAV